MTLLSTLAPRLTAQYALCERATASGSSPQHVRQLTAAGMFPGGDADSLALCGARVAWDTSAITPLDLLDAAPRQHSNFRYCQECVNAVQAIVDGQYR